MGQTVKYIKETDDAYTIGGYGVVWGGRDLLGDYFDQTTDFWTDRITSTPPVLYEHGMDGATRKAVLGQVVEMRSDDTGMWIEAQLEKSRAYVDAVMELVNAGVLGWSSGAVSHLCERTKDGHITSWALAEFSLTPDPAEPRTLGVQDLSGLDDDPQIKSLIAAIKATEPTAIEIPESEPLSLTVDRTIAMASALVERTKGLHQRRLSEGRSLSEANREAVKLAYQELDIACGLLEEILLDSRGPDPAAKANESDGVRLKIAIQAERIRMLAS